MIFAVKSSSAGRTGPLAEAAGKAAVFAPGGEFYSAPGVFLAAAGPLSSLYRDPVSSSAAVFDGELYNAAELRAALAAAGAACRGETAAELALRACLLWGPDCVRRFNGVWSFAVWRGGGRELFCSRDRVGARPFYFHEGRGVFSACSSLRALLSCRFVPAGADDAAVFDYLSGARTRGGERTFFSGAKQLQAGCRAFARAGEAAEVSRWYEPDYEPSAGSYSPKLAAVYAERLGELLKDAVGLRLAGGAACSMSGGLDSASVACLAGSIAGGGVKVYSLAYENEARRISALSKALRLRHCRLNPAALEGISWGELAELLSCLEEPQAEPSFLGEGLLAARAALDGERALLGGMGADELLAGHRDRYSEVFLRQLACAGDAARFRTEYGLLFPGRPAREMVPPREYLRAALGRRRTPDPLLARALAPDFLEAHCGQAREEARPELNLQRLLRRDSLSFSNPYFPSGGVWARQPFQDHRLLEFALSLPACYKLHAGQTKHLLRLAMRGRLPAAITGGGEKLPTPTAPYKRLLLRDKAKLRKTLAGAAHSAGVYLDKAGALAAFEELFLGAVAPETDTCSLLWRLVNLELWLADNARLLRGDRLAAAAEVGQALRGTVRAGRILARCAAAATG